MYKSAFVENDSVSIIPLKTIRKFTEEEDLRTGYLMGLAAVAKQMVGQWPNVYIYTCKK